MSLRADPIQGTLNDEQLDLRDNFIHQGYMQRTKDDLCKDSKEECRGAAVTATGSMMGDSMVDAVAKMYGMFFSFGGKLSLKQGATEAEQHRDYCAMIPMGTEMVSMAVQTSSQQMIMARPVDPEQNQVDSLYKAAESHETRTKTAAIQAGGWGAAFTCYTVATLAQMSGGVDRNAGIGRAVKMAATGGLAAFYSFKAIKSSEAADKIRAIADDLLKKAGKGTCDPIKHTSCYCAQPETQYDPKYCIPQDYLGRDGQKPDTLISCVDANLNTDPQCNCKASNSCYDSKFAQMESSFGPGTATLASTMKPTFTTFKGNFDSGAVNGQVKANLAAAKKYFKENPFKKFDGALSQKQKDEVKAMMDLGLTEDGAAHIAAMGLNEKGREVQADLRKDMSAMTGAADYLSELSKNGAGGRGASSGSKLLYFGGEGGGRHVASSGNSGFNMDMLNKLKKKDAGAGDSKILDFAERATREAQINKDTSKSLFELISNRYRTSTWERFNVFAAPK